uniref:dnaJ homolog subfamily C member 12 isoform X2 n=1 Tax=Myxine glutinosa TaxID=7769 RepID=UPI00358F17B3
MDAILNYTKDPASDYYHLIGCNEFSSMEQILTEYKIRVLQCHPDKHPDNPTADKQFRMLQRAREVLGDPEMRAQYDEWCHAGYSDESFAHGSFLWTADTPSELLRKFRNYEL